MNFGFASFSIVGSLLVLRSMWLTIPDVDRGAYCWITAPLYPWRVPTLFT